MKTFFMTCLMLSFFSNLVFAGPRQLEPLRLPILSVGQSSPQQLLVSVGVFEGMYKDAWTGYVNVQAELDGLLQVWTVTHTKILVKYSETDIQDVSESQTFQKPGDALDDWFNELDLYGNDFVVQITLKAPSSTSSLQIQTVAEQIHLGHIFQVYDFAYGEAIDPWSD